MATILVIDDSQSILHGVERALSRSGHTVLTSDSGGKAIPMLGKTRVDLVITDMYMPGGDGVQVIQHARRSAPGVAVLAMSGRPPEANLFPIARALGAIGTLQKPFGVKQLLHAVALALNQDPAGPEYLWAHDNSFGALLEDDPPAEGEAPREQPAETGAHTLTKS